MNAKILGWIYVEQPKAKQMENGKEYESIEKTRANRDCSVDAMACLKQMCIDSLK